MNGGITGNVGPPNPGLTITERSCLLRAARVRLSQLHEEYDLHHAKGEQGSPRMEALFNEISCVTAGIAWLWMQHAE